MARNIEIKARVEDLAEIRARAMILADAGPSVLEQTDTFYNTRIGRLKLREFADRGAELIAYHRDDSPTAKTSTYRVMPVVDPRALDEALALAPGRRGVIRKRRELFLSGQTRIHLDMVEGLGAFIELEVVMRDGQSVSEGERIVEDLLEKLGVGAEQLVAEAYIDLLEEVGA